MTVGLVKWSVCFAATGRISFRSWKYASPFSVMV